MCACEGGGIGGGMDTDTYSPFYMTRRLTAREAFEAIVAHRLDSVNKWN
jgi:hypothetical protein